MQPFSGSQIIDSRYCVTFDFDSCSVQDHCTSVLLGAGPRRHDGLWELDWIRLPFAATVASLPAPVADSTSSSQQWHRRLGHLRSSCLSSLVHRGVLGSFSGNASLDCLGCRLGKQIQLPYSHNESMYERPFDLVHSDVWGSAPSRRKGVIATMLSL
jgi:hypothetical protein